MEEAGGKCSDRDSLWTAWELEAKCLGECLGRNSEGVVIMINIANVMRSCWMFWDLEILSCWMLIDFVSVRDVIRSHLVWRS